MSVGVWFAGDRNWPGADWPVSEKEQGKADARMLHRVSALLSVDQSVRAAILSLRFRAKCSGPLNGRLTDTEPGLPNVTHITDRGRQTFLSEDRELSR